MGYICTLDLDGNTCSYQLYGRRCQGYENCAFCQSNQQDRIEPRVQSSGYDRKERWYEKYYQPAGMRKEINS